MGADLIFLSQALASQGITAEQWANAVSEVIGGKSGGKEPTRQGQGTKPENLEQAVAEAEKFLTEKIKDLKI